MNIAAIKRKKKSRPLAVIVMIAFVLGTAVNSLLFSRSSSLPTPSSPLPPSSFTAKTSSSLPQQKRDGPFQMPINGERFSIFQPIYDTTISVPQLMAPTKDFIRTFQQRIEWVSPMVVESDPSKKEMSSNEHAKLMYLEMMKNILTAIAFSDAERSVHAELEKNLKLKEIQKLSLSPLNLELRSRGKDWTFAGDTMTGSARMDNIRDLLQDVVKNNVEGDYIETGVWRGGASIYARAVLATLGETDHRVSYVCDSFQGLPPGDRSLDKQDKGWESAYLEIPKEIVADNFNKYGLLDSNVVFAKGFFNETMPPLSKKIGTLAVMRLDGDMYESTVDVIYNLYDKLSIGGYVIMDDWARFPSRTAVEDFFTVHDISPEIIDIDGMSAYWKKNEQVDIQYWRYEQLKFKEEK